MDLRRDEAIQNFMATMPTVETFIPAMVDACNLGARRQQVIEVVSHSPLASIFEAKYRATLASLSTEEIEEITALFATESTSRVAAVLKWASSLAWAATEVKGYIDDEFDRLLSEGTED
jgi:hypothetical protein